MFLQTTDIIKEEILGYLNILDRNEKNNNKKESIYRLNFFIRKICCTNFILYVQSTLFQGPGFGIQYSIGKNPYPPSSFFPDETWGINNGRDNRWPNGIIPYTFDYTRSDPADNITLSKLHFFTL